MHRSEPKIHTIGKAFVAMPEPQCPTLFGNVLEIKFEYENHQFWACADYYLESAHSYLVSYKVGLIDSWFATSFEYGVFFDDIHIECSEDEIADILRENIEEKKEYAAKRYLESVYKFMFYCDRPKHKGLVAHTLAFISSSSDTGGNYVPFEGICKSVLIRAKGNISYYGHFNVDGTGIQLFGTETDATYIRVGDIAVSDQDESAIEKRLYEYHETRMIQIHPAIQTMQMEMAVSQEKNDPNWEQAIAPYREREVKLWPEL